MYGKRTTIAIISALALTFGYAAAQTAIPHGNASVSQGENAAATYFTRDSIGDVQLGRLGLDKSKNASVRTVANALVKDHTMTADKGMQVARAIGDSDVKWAPGAGNQMDLTRLNRYSGAEFDREYIKTLIQAHQQDISMAQDALKFVTDSRLRSYLQTTLQVDRKHLSMAQQAQSKL